MLKYWLTPYNIWIISQFEEIKLIRKCIYISYSLHHTETSRQKKIKNTRQIARRTKTMKFEFLFVSFYICNIVNEGIGAIPAILISSIWSMTNRSAVHVSCRCGHSNISQFFWRWNCCIGNCGCTNGMQRVWSRGNRGKLIYRAWLMYRNYFVTRYTYLNRDGIKKICLFKGTHSLKKCKNIFLFLLW